jgi:formylglycine-generating enzyme required for sulfatase activity
LPTTLPAALGRYQLTKLLGQGGMGAVYLAHDTQLERWVALKLPLNAEPERLMREARAAAGLHHPHICPVYDAGTLDGVLYLTLAYIDGPSLATALRHRPVWPLADAVALVRTVAEAMGFAHRQGVLHRDLKPANILLNAQGQPVVTDFGLAKRVGPVGVDPTLTATGMTLGTPAYMSPEQAMGQGKRIRAPADVYALGVILFELVTGRRPFVGATGMEVVLAILTTPPEPPSRLRPEIDAPLERIICQCLAKDPEDRFADGQALAEALATWQAAALPPPAGCRPPPPSIPDVTAPPEPLRGREGWRMPFAWITPGRFFMGSPLTFTAAEDDEQPRHQVALTQGFALGVYPVTQAEWQQVMGANPARFKGDTRPVENVSWEECAAFVNRLNGLEAGQGWAYRLPTEAEWEYACRAGSPSKYHFGEDAARLEDYAWFAGNAANQTHPVGQKRPNAWGLYDMHGNVWEWCQDWYDRQAYQRGNCIDPVGPDRGANRVGRGGCWYDPAGSCRAASRGNFHPAFRDPYLGLRLVRVPAAG